MSTSIDYLKIRDMIGTVVTDGEYEYVISDFMISRDAYQMWCKTRQQFYFTGYHALHVHGLFAVVSG